MTIWLDLPLPPSTNELTANSKAGGRHKTKRYVEWLTSAGWSLRAQLAKADRRSILGPYDLAVYVHSATPGDINNRDKAISDLLVTARVTDDDRRQDSITVRRAVNVPPGRAWVAVRGAKPGAALCPWEGAA